MSHPDILRAKERIVREHFAPLLRACKGEGWGAAFMTGAEVVERLHPNHVDIDPYGEYIVATAEKGYHYFIDVSADSPLTMIYDAVKLLQYK